MNYTKKNEEVLVIEKNGEKINILVDKENGIAIVYSEKHVLKFSIDKNNPIESLEKKLQAKYKRELYNETRDIRLDSVVDIKETSKKMIDYMKATEAYLQDEFVINAKEIEKELDSYGIVTKELLCKIWDELLAVYISDELMDNIYTIHQENMLDELIVLEADKVTESTIEKFSNFFEKERNEEKKEPAEDPKYQEEIEKVKQMIFEQKLTLREYDDDYYYDAYFKVTNFGVKELSEEDSNDCMILQIRQDFEFAQFVNPNIETKEMNIKTFIETVETLRKLGKLIGI